MKISIITVSFNAAEVIERTIMSVITQSYSDKEYIIVDGASNDETCSVISKYMNSVDKFISEPDSGIYEAMNKGVRLATGDFCIFMNAGDRFVDKNVLERVATYLSPRYTIVMGNQIFLTKRGWFHTYEKAWKFLDRDRLYFDSLYHQSSFISRDYLIKNPYDERFRMVSDWKMALDVAFDPGLEYLCVDIDVAVFYEDGITYTKAGCGKDEREKILPYYYTTAESNRLRSEFVNYKRVTNAKRYFNYIRRVANNFLKMLSYT